MCCRVLSEERRLPISGSTANVGEGEVAVRQVLNLGGSVKPLPALATIGADRAGIAGLVSILRQNGIPQTFLGSLAATLFSFSVLGHVKQSLFLWPVSAVSLGFALPFLNRSLRTRAAVQVSTGAGFLLGCLLEKMPVELAAILAFIKILDLLLGKAILGRGIQQFDDLRNQSNSLRFIAMLVTVPLVTGALGAFPVAHYLKHPVLQTGIADSLAISLGFAIVLPAILLLKQAVRNRQRLTGLFQWRATLAGAFFLFVAAFVFWQNRAPFLFLIFPPMVMVLLVMGLEGAVFTSLALSLVGWVATMRGHGPIWLMQGTELEHLLALQFFVWVALVTALPIGALLDERRRAEAATRRALAEQQRLRKELEATNLQLERLATTDGLTGLHNRRYFEKFMKTALATARRNGQPLSLLMMDIDNFKQRNDAHGHAAGDKALKVLADTLMSSFRESDVVARIGGEEFAVLLHAAEQEECAALAARLQKKLSSASHGPAPLTVSIGMATLGAATLHGDELMLQADAAMYAAKRAGKDRAIHFHNCAGATMLPEEDSPRLSGWGALSAVHPAIAMSV